MSDCQQPSPPLLIQGIEEFNRGQYYVCHETLEDLWMQESAPVRELYQGILQVGVGLYKWQRNKYRGAVKLLHTGVDHLHPFTPTCQGVDVARLITDANRAREALIALGPERMQQMDRRLIPQVRWTVTPDRSSQVTPDQQGAFHPMKAVTFHERGGPEVLRYEELPQPEIGPGEVLVRVRACALNHLDIFTRQGKQGVKASLPHIGGLETAGVIAEAAPDVQDVRAGERVLVAPFVVCGQCEYCRADLENLCENRTIIGVQAHGGFAEYMKAPARNVISIPEGLSFEEAAATPSAFGTAWHMLIDRAGLQRGEWVLVLAAGSGIGTAAIQIAKHFDCSVIATASTQAKLDKAVELGADHVVNYAEERFDLAVHRITSDRGVDVVFEHVGENTWKESVASLRPTGRLVTCGGTTGRWGQTDIWSLFGKQLSLLGSFGAVQSDFETVLELVGKGIFQPIISQVFPLAETARAQAEIEDRKHFGKVIVVPEN